MVLNLKNPFFSQTILFDRLTLKLFKGLILLPNNISLFIILFIVQFYRAIDVTVINVQKYF